MLYRKIKLENKKAQVGETMTWVVATLIIVVILIISISIAGGVGWVKDILDLEKKIGARFLDRVPEQSFYAYLLTKDSDGKIIYEQLKYENGFNNFNGILAKKILSLYDDNYFGVWTLFIQDGENSDVKIIYNEDSKGVISRVSPPDILKIFHFNKDKILSLGLFSRGKG
ncbi:MAG: hypothetical protein ABIH59_00550 [archaeon]